MNLPWNDLPRVTDQYGHSIPITGTWCRACGYPTHPDHDDLHPLCDEPATTRGPALVVTKEATA